MDRRTIEYGRLSSKTNEVTVFCTAYPLLIIHYSIFLINRQENNRTRYKFHQNLSVLIWGFGPFHPWSNRILHSLPIISTLYINNNQRITSYREIISIRLSISYIVLLFLWVIPCSRIFSVCPSINVIRQQAATPAAPGFLLFRRCRVVRTCLKKPNILLHYYGSKVYKHYAIW